MSDFKTMSDSGNTSASEASIGEARPDSPVATRVYPSPNHGERKGGEKSGRVTPDSIILHYTGMPSASEALLWLANPISEVSCHYFVFEDGRVWQMVPEARRAWHAGRSSWQGETDMNSRSIGIEIANPGHDLSKAFASEVGTGSREANASRERLTIPGPLPPVGPDFPGVQIDAVIALVKDIAARWNIPAARIVAHSDIAPGRKIDPGEGFPWEKLAQAGVGLWPDKAIAPLATLPSYRPGDEGLPVAALQSMFAKFGYGIEITGVYDQRTADVVTAFQRHWRQGCVDGVADGETVGVLRALMTAAQA
ncbi:MAG: N-acetylmuramoyl-L-alanine [Beijerinckiaceae bacterium]|nr:MAG: N-acetylmuramoyl-L-alanine [Beijerinckiaceae bacterium]